MSAPAYSPFDKELGALAIDDLAVLRQVFEGWYVEYKREIPSAISTAKSISAFANTYGGWLFYGVEEQSKESPVAGSFPGVSREEVDCTLQRMRQAVAEHVNPVPHFETKVLWGPSALLGLNDHHAIICVRVPWSPNAPHVHKKGVIFRRVSDSSEPRPENDRFVLDQLWRRGDEIRQEFQEWHDRDPEFAEGERKNPYVRLLLAADLWRDRNLWVDLGTEDVRAILGATPGLLSAIPFDTVYTSADGFIGRQLAGNDPNNLTLTWRLRPSLLSDVIIPLPLYAPSEPKLLYHEMQGYEGVGRFVKILERYTLSSPRVIDLNYLFNILIGVVEIQRRLTEKAGWTHGYFAKTKLLNTWRTVPYVDVHSVLDEFEKFGPPMCLDKLVTSPRGTDPESFIQVGDYSDLSDERIRILLQALLIFSPIARAFGLPRWIDATSEGELIPYLVALQEAGGRAVVAQRLRNERLRRYR